MNDRLRVLTDEPGDGPTNMGRDQALLARVGTGSSTPTLRLYTWSPATISLGRFQPFDEYEALAARVGPLPVVRRVTGGGAILHDAELTYSLTLPRRHRLAAGNPACLYDPVHAAIIQAARDFGVEAERRGPGEKKGSGYFSSPRMVSRRGSDEKSSLTPFSPLHTRSERNGPFFCFARRHATDVVVGSAKLAGSAQRRSRDAVLQHGSIILADRRGLQPSAAFGANTSVERLASVLTQHLARCLHVSFAPGTWSDDERVAARREADRFRDPAWTRRR